LETHLFEVESPTSWSERVLTHLIVPYLMCFHSLRMALT
jgi:hypothetical protein